MSNVGIILKTLWDAAESIIFKFLMVALWINDGVIVKQTFEKYCLVTIEIEKPMNVKHLNGDCCIILYKLKKIY